MSRGGGPCAPRRLPLLGGVRPTNENLAPAWGVAGSGRFERPRDEQVLDAARIREDGIRPEVRKHFVDTGRSLAIDQRNANDVGSCENWNGELARVCDVDFFAVERDIDEGPARNSTTRPPAGHRKFVFGVERKRVPDEHSAAGAKRKTFDVTVVREAGRRGIGHLVGAERAIAYGLAADLHRGGDISLNQRGRNSQCLRDIVKPFTRTVGRQQRRDVDVQREEVANGVPVSVRFNRWRAGVPRLAPGTAARSSRASSSDANASSAARSGRRAPLGGIMPVLIFRTTFSQVSAFAATCEMSSMSSARSAVFIRWLWQVMQVPFEKSGLCTGHRTLPREWFRRLDRLKTAPLDCHRHEDDNEKKSQGHGWAEPDLAVSCLIISIEPGFGRAGWVARNTPSAQVSGVRPSLSLTSSLAPLSTRN